MAVPYSFSAKTGRFPYSQQEGPSFKPLAKPDLETNKSVAVELTPDQQQNVKNLLSSDLINCPITQLRNRYCVLDLAYYMENMNNRNPEQRIMANATIKEIYANMELPILQPNIDAAHAYQCGTFLYGIPIFGVVSDERDEAQQKAAEQLEAIIFENSVTTGWARHIAMALKDGLKYNIGAVQCEWHQRQIYQPLTNINTPGSTRSYSENTQILRGGNEMKYMDMYNTWFDPSVPAAEVHVRGDYAGWCESMTLAQVYQFMMDLRQFGGVTMNHNDNLWKSMPARNWHYIPRILTDQVLADPGRDWGGWFNWNMQPMQYGTANQYEVMCFERRIIPCMLGIDKVPDKDQVQIWRFVEINGYIVYAERKTNAHNWLSMLFCQPNEDGLRNQSKGLGETLLNFQNLQGSLFRARIASLARSISDRGIYDPSLISSDDINSKNPAAKVPVRPRGYGTDLRQAYFPIPYNDNTAGTIWQEIAQLDQKASDAAHINKSQRGQFTKGNRTLREYADVMDNSDSTQQCTAMHLETQLFTPMKNIVKLNTLQYQSTANLINPNTKSLVEINPVDLRRQSLNFKIADGLMPKDKLLSIPETLEAGQILAAMQQSQAGMMNPNMPQYDIIGMMVDSLAARGARIKKYQIQAPTPQQMAVMNGATGVPPQ